MRKPANSGILIAGVCFSLGALTAAMAFKWGTLRGAFYEVRLVEIVQTAATVVVACLVSFVLNRRLGTGFKQRELVISAVEHLRALLKEVFSNGQTYMEDGGLNNAQVILAELKQTSMFLSFLIRLKKEVPFRIHIGDSTTRGYWAFKKCLTDSPFGESKGVYSLQRRKNLTTLYELLVEELELCKLRLYR